MSKRRKLSEGKDRISQLPEELLLKILSGLTVKEAGQTSLISSRWKTLWTLTTGRLEFIADPVEISRLTLDTRWEGRDDYTRWVNKVTKLHKSGRLEGFKVCFDLDNIYSNYLDEWIEFAIRNRSASLDIDLRRFFPKQRGEPIPYHFPKQVFSSSNVRLITELILYRVNVSGSDLENIVSNCVLLESLLVSESETLIGGVTISGLNLLRYFGIEKCDNVELFEISAANLRILMYEGPGLASIRISHAPKLKSLLVGGGYCAKYFPLFPEVSPFFNQIESLTLDYSHAQIYELVDPKFPESKILKKLVLAVPSFDYESLLKYMSFFKGCPMLHTLLLGFAWVDNLRCRSTNPLERRQLEENERLNCLKEVEFFDFGGRRVDVELVSCILENAPNVDTITFWSPYNKDTLPLSSICIDEDTKECARQIANKHSPAARLVFCS